MAEAATNKGFLGWVEKTGNRLPDPVFLFFYLIIALVVVSIVAALSGVSAFHPTAIDEATGSALRIDGVPLGQSNADDWRAALALIPQKPHFRYRPRAVIIAIMLEVE